MGTGGRCATGLIAAALLLGSGMALAQTSLQEEIERVEGSIRLAEMLLGTCAARLDALEPPALGAPEDDWKKFYAVVDEVRSCIARLETALDVLKKQLGELMKKLQAATVPDRSHLEEKIREYQRRVAEAERAKDDLKKKVEGLLQRAKR